MHVLRVDASVSTTSVSRRLADAFTDELRTVEPLVEITHLDLADNPPPHLTDEALRTLHRRGTPCASKANLPTEETLSYAEQVLLADVVIISSPVYNWSLPSNLKAWLDRMLVPGVTLPSRDTPHPLPGRSAVILLAYGGSGQPKHTTLLKDHARPYLECLFGGTLGMQTHVISALYAGMPHSQRQESAPQEFDVLVENCRRVARDLTRAGSSSAAAATHINQPLKEKV